MIKRVLVLANSLRDQSVAHQVIDSFTKKGLRVVEKNADLIVTVGGDGTYLYHMKKLRFPQTPVIGVNAGTLGYFQELTLAELDEFIDDLILGDYRTAYRSLLEIVDAQGGVCGRALNEIYISRNSPRSMKAKLTIGKGEFAQFVGDGLIFNTTQGSTAYAAAAGGPVIAEELPVYGIVPSNAHDTTLYESVRAPVIVSSDIQSSVEVRDADERPVRVEADGDLIDIDVANKMTIRVSETKVTVLRTKRFDYFERLSYKMIHRRRP